MLNVPAFVGLPVMVPVVVLKVKSAGNLLPDCADHDQVYGVGPPVAVRVVLYFVFSFPPGRLDVVILTGGKTIVNDADATALLAIFVLKAMALSVHELVRVMPVLAYAVDLLVGMEPLVV